LNLPLNEVSFKRLKLGMALFAVKHLERHDAYDHHPREIDVRPALPESGGILARPVKKGALREVAFLLDLYF
jgi:hypothetical protein